MNKELTNYGELDLLLEHKPQFSFKGKRGHIVQLSISNLIYPNQSIDTETPHDQETV